jgi:hypothetical protein
MIKKQYFLIIFLALFACKEAVNKNAETTSETEVPLVEPLVNPSEANSELPRLFSNGTDLYFSWVTRKDSLDVLNYSVLKDSSWSAPETIISGSDWFTNWADFPSIAESNGNILTSFLQKSDTGTYTYDVKLNLYNAKTKTWKKNFILHNDGTQSEHGFVTIRPYVGDSFFITWLDGRETVGKGHGGGQMTLRSAIVFEDGTIDYDNVRDARVCDCCQTTAAIGANDELIIAYRDRSDDEIRDISVVDWTMERGWSEPKTIGKDHWKIAGCPVNGPSMDAYESTAAVAWFTASEGEGDIKVAFSLDNGATFGSSFRIDGSNATGRVDLVMLSEEEAAVLWMEPSGDDEVIRLMKINKHGYTGMPVTISKTKPERASGFPQLERIGDVLFVAWTEVEANKKTAIKTGSIPVSALQ